MIGPAVEAALGVAVGAVAVFVVVFARRARRGRETETWPEWWQPIGTPLRSNVRIVPRDRRPR